MSAPPRSLKTAGYVDASKLPRGPGGGTLCRWCRQEIPVGSARRTFCSGEKASFSRKTGEIVSGGDGCVHEHCLRSNPGYARECLWARDRGKCALCPTVCARKGGGWQADHIVPVVEGGGSCGLDNLRTLCTECHKRETAKLRARLAGRRNG
jgi:5-methylcytosine-specific restriction protein A